MRPKPGDLLVRDGDEARTPLTPADIVADAKPTVAWAMDPSGGPAMKKLNAAVAAFISDPKSLMISFDARTRPVKFREIGEIRTPDALMDLLEIDAKAGP